MTQNPEHSPLFLIFWVQDKGHFKIYMHLFVCIETQCYCQVVIQSYPFASIKSLQAVDGEVDGIGA